MGKEIDRAIDIYRRDVLLGNSDRLFVAIFEFVHSHGCKQTSLLRELILIGPWNRKLCKSALTIRLGFGAGHCAIYSNLNFVVMVGTRDPYF